MLRQSTYTIKTFEIDLNSDSSASKTKTEKSQPEMIIPLSDLFMESIKTIKQQFDGKLKNHIQEQQALYLNLHRVSYQNYLKQTISKLNSNQDNQLKFKIITQFILNKNQIGKKMNSQDKILQTVNYKDFKEKYYNQTQIMDDMVKQPLQNIQKISKTMKYQLLHNLLSTKNNIQVRTKSQLMLLRQNIFDRILTILGSDFQIDSDVVSHLNKINTKQMVLRVCNLIIQTSHENLCLQHLENLTILNIPLIKVITENSYLFNIHRIKKLSLFLNIQPQINIQNLISFLNQAKSLKQLNLNHITELSMFKLNQDIAQKLQSLKLHFQKQNINNSSFVLLTQLQLLKNLDQLHIDFGNNTLISQDILSRFIKYLKQNCLYKIDLNFNDLVINDRTLFFLTHAIKSMKFLFYLKINIPTVGISTDSIRTLFYVISCSYSIKQFYLNIKIRGSQTQFDRLESYWKQKLEWRNSNQNERFQFKLQMETVEQC